MYFLYWISNVAGKGKGIELKKLLKDFVEASAVEQNMAYELLPKITMLLSSSHEEK